MDSDNEVLVRKKGARAGYAMALHAIDLGTMVAPEGDCILVGRCPLSVPVLRGSNPRRSSPKLFGCNGLSGALRFKGKRCCTPTRIEKSSGALCVSEGRVREVRSGAAAHGGCRIDKSVPERAGFGKAIGDAMRQ